MHVFPRQAGDDLCLSDARTRWVDATERAPYAARLRDRLVADRQLEPPEPQPT